MRTSIRSQRPSSSPSRTGKAISATRISWTSLSIRSWAAPTRWSEARPSTPGRRLPQCRLPAGSPATRHTSRRSPQATRPPGLRPIRRSSASSTVRGTHCARLLRIPAGIRRWCRERGWRCRPAATNRGRCAATRSCLAPGKRPRLTPNPCFALAPGRWIMPFGTPGGDTQIQANLQFLLNRLAFGMALQDAVEAPRLVTHSHPNSFAPHAARPRPRHPGRTHRRGNERPARRARGTASSAWTSGRTGQAACARSARTSRRAKSKAPPTPGA